MKGPRWRIGLTGRNVAEVSPTQLVERVGRELRWRMWRLGNTAPAGVRMGRKRGRSLPTTSCHVTSSPCYIVSSHKCAVSSTLTRLAASCKHISKVLVCRCGRNSLPSDLIKTHTGSLQATFHSLVQHREGSCTAQCCHRQQ